MISGIPIPPIPEVDPTSYVIFVVVAIFLIGIVIGLASRTALLRDSCPFIHDFKSRPYSLAKSQLAFWTVIMIGCYLFIYIDNPSIVRVFNNTALELLGISMATSALAGATGPPVAGVATPTAPSVPRPAPAAAAIQLHRNYILDILSDDQGMNLHRIQMVLWTLVFGGLFLYECYKYRNFPNFAQQNFVVMGISSATYVWFRRTEG